MNKKPLEAERDRLADEYFKRDKHPLEKPGDPCSYYAGFGAAVKLMLENGIRVYACPESTGQLFEWAQDKFPGVTHTGVVISVEALALVPEFTKP